MKVSWIITRRELREIVRDSNLLIPLLLLPVLMGVLAGLSTWVTARGPQSVGVVITTAVLDQLPMGAQQRLAEAQVQAMQAQAEPTSPLAGLPPPNLEQFTIGTFLKAFGLPLFWIVAVALTPALAADSFVGEKERGTIEPLLASPITNRELFVGKLLGSIIPSVLGTWLGVLVFAVLVGLSRSPYYPPFVLADRDWLFSCLVIVPLVALLAAGVGALISTRVSTYRVAYQVTGLIVLPVILVLIPQAAVLYLFTPMAFVYTAAFILVLDAVIVAFALHSVDRERLLRGA